MTAKKELVLRLLHRITVEYKLDEYNHYAIEVSSDGKVLFTTPRKTGQCNVDAGNAKDFIQNRAGSIFLKDSDFEGTPSIDSYHWKVSFYTKNGLVRTMDGWHDEPVERFYDYERFLSDLEGLANEDFGAYAQEKLAHEKERAQRISDAIEKAKSVGDAKCMPARDSVLTLSQKLLTSTACKNDPRKNLLISPLSIEAILCLLSCAARGESREELISFLNVDSEETITEIGNLIDEIVADKAATVANAIYTDKATAPYFLPDFLKRISETVATDILPSNGDAIKIINEWANKKTYGMIPELFSPGSKVDNLALLNAVSFEANWFEEYNVDDISDGIFYRLDGGMEKARFLHSTEDYVIYDESAIGFLKPYAGPEFASEFLFMGLLPQKTKDPIEFIKALPADGIGSFIRSAAKVDVKVTIPEFSFDNTIDMKDVLEREGVKSLFNARTADISNMIALPDSFISKITHKTHIEVDRHGTKADAVTAMWVCAGCLPELPYFEVTLDRPFLFGIVHRKTNLPLFLGVVNTLKN